MYNSHVKDRRVWHEFQDVTIPNRKTIHAFIFSLRQTGLLPNEKRYNSLNHWVLSEGKLDETGGKLQHFL
jgi:hypothetical protein